MLAIVVVVDEKLVIFVACSANVRAISSLLKFIQNLVSVSVRPCHYRSIEKTQRKQHGS